MSRKYSQLAEANETAKNVNTNEINSQNESHEKNQYLI